MLYLTVGFGWIHRCAMTRCDNVCVRGSIIGMAATVLWMIFVAVYTSHLKSKYRRMLEEQATADAKSQAKAKAESQSKTKETFRELQGLRRSQKLEATVDADK